MKRLLRTLPLFVIALLITSCVSVRVSSDYDQAVNFSKYKTFAFYKAGIDEAEISDLDKRRILRAIEAELMAKGFTKSEDPDLLVSIFTKSRERINVWNGGWGGWGGFGWGGWGGWGWNGWGWGAWGAPNYTRSTEGQLYVDLIDADKRELVWQGVGTGYLTQNREKKEQRIREFVGRIMEKYPPGAGN